MQLETCDVLTKEGAFPLKYWAGIYHVSERKLRNDIAAGKLRCLRFGRAIRITERQMNEYVASLED